MSFRISLCILSALLLSFLLEANEVRAESIQETNKYNVLFIAVDDLRTELGCYGLPYVQSPNLDQLAAESVLFKNHFVQVPTCGASRYALLTGRSPAQSGVTRSNAGLYQGKAALSQKKTMHSQSMPELFRRSGYHTVGIGKISHSPDGFVYDYSGKGDGRLEVPHAWDDLPTPFGPWKRNWGIFFAYANGKHREDGNGHKDLMEFVVDKDNDLPDGMMAETAIEKLKALKDSPKPFFMGLGFFKPHLPFVATKQDWEAFKDMDVPMPKHPEKYNSKYWHKSGEFYKYSAPHEKTSPLANEAIVQSRKAYLACVRYVDRQIGKVLDTLKDEGLDKNTIVVVWGDHGWFLGDSAMWAKHCPWERALKSTLMIRVPNNTKPQKSNALVETIDLYPTLVELCKTKETQTEYPLDGKSLVPILSQEKKEVRDVSISYWNKTVSIRSQKHRLITTVKNDKHSNVELFDIQKSPDPIKNLKDDAPQIVKQLWGLAEPKLKKK